jgi:hypothetical protein
MDILKRLLAPLLCVCLAVASSGCAMCYTPYDDHYNAFGGVAERQDRVHGRVGSILSDPSFQYSDGGMGEAATEADLYRLESDEPHLESIDLEPTPADVDI